MGFYYICINIRAGLGRQLQFSVQVVSVAGSSQQPRHLASQHAHPIASKDAKLEVLISTFGGLALAPRSCGHLL